MHYISLLVGHSSMDIHDRARVLANKSNMSQKHSCLILRKGKIISEGYNYPMETFCHKYSLHAEVVALIGLKNMPKWWLKECTMFVFRISNTDPDSFRMSKPCADCQKAIILAGIGKVFYTCD